MASVIFNLTCLIVLGIFSIATKLNLLEAVSIYSFFMDIQPDPFEGHFGRTFNLTFLRDIQHDIFMDISLDLFVGYAT